MTTKPFIEIHETVGGKVATAYRPAEGHCPMLMGIALASATRVITQSFLAEMELGEEHRKPIEREIVATYLRDLQMGDMGEAESTDVKDLS
jgi:hypothetical protein